MIACTTPSLIPTLVGAITCPWPRCIIRVSCLLPSRWRAVPDRRTRHQPVTPTHIPAACTSLLLTPAATCVPTTLRAAVGSSRRRRSAKLPRPTAAVGPTIQSTATPAAWGISQPVRGAHPAQQQGQEQAPAEPVHPAAHRPAHHTRAPDPDPYHPHGRRPRPGERAAGAAGRGRSRCPRAHHPMTGMCPREVRPGCPCTRCCTRVGPHPGT